MLLFGKMTWYYEILHFRQQLKRKREKMFSVKESNGF